MRGIVLLIPVKRSCWLRIDRTSQSICFDRASDVRSSKVRTSRVSYQQEPSQPRGNQLGASHEAQMVSTLGLAEVMLALPWFSTLRVPIKLMAHHQLCSRTLYCSCRASSLDAEKGLCSRWLYRRSAVNPIRAGGRNSEPVRLAVCRAVHSVLYTLTFVESTGVISFAASQTHVGLIPDNPCDVRSVQPPLMARRLAQFTRVPDPKT